MVVEHGFPGPDPRRDSCVGPGEATEDPTLGVVMLGVVVVGSCLGPCPRVGTRAGVSCSTGYWKDTTGSRTLDQNGCTSHCHLLGPSGSTSGRDPSADGETRGGKRDPGEPAGRGV